MAFDALRNDAYRAAIERVVTPDSVVLDLGCGLGVHGLMAARAGARRVFLVDPEIAVHSALEIAQHNGYGSRVEAFQGRIEEITLPERVDVIISVFTGNMLYSEDLLPSLFHARDRWLKPGGHLIPHAAELMLAPVACQALHEEHVLSWLVDTSGFDYSPLRRYAANAFVSDREAVEQPIVLAEAQSLATVHFHSASSNDLESSVTFEIQTSGVCHGLHAWVRIHFGQRRLSTGPGSPTMHWTPQTLLFDQPLPVETGQYAHVRLRRPDLGEWTWECRLGAEHRRQSTFLGQPLRATHLSKLSSLAQPKLSPRGEAAWWVLSRLASPGASTGALQTGVRETFPQLFESDRQSRAFVTQLLLRHAQ